MISYSINSFSLYIVSHVNLNRFTAIKINTIRQNIVYEHSSVHDNYIETKRKSCAVQILIFMIYKYQKKNGKIIDSNLDISRRPENNR